MIVARFYLRGPKSPVRESVQRFCNIQAWKKIEETKKKAKDIMHVK